MSWTGARGLLLAVAAVIGAACSTEPAPSTSSVQSLSVPERVVAGERVEVRVEVDGDGEVVVAIDDAYLTTTLLSDTSGAVDGFVSFEVPLSITSSTGLLTFRVAGSVGEAFSATTEVRPGGVTDRIEAVVGPRTVVADGADETMVVALAVDRFGNPPADGSPIDVHLVEESGEVTVLSASVEGGVAGRRVGSSTVAQGVDVFATADAGEVSSQPVDFDEVAGPAAAVGIELVGSVPRADGRALVGVRTSVIADRFGNVVPDGRIVSLRADGPDGVGQLTARTIDGRADFSLVAPSSPGTVVVVAAVDQVVSDALNVGFASAVSDLPIEVDPESRIVAIGPVLDAFGAVLDDGIDATVSVVDADGRVIATEQLQLRQGSGVVDLDPNVIGAAATLHVDVLGERRTAGWS